MQEAIQKTTEVDGMAKGIALTRDSQTTLGKDTGKREKYWSSLVANWQSNFPACTRGWDSPSTLKRRY